MASRPVPRRRAVGVVSLGCPKNLVDTEVMLGLLKEAGFDIVSDAEEATVLLVNTCCFIEGARGEAAEALTEATEWKRAAEGRVLVCAGCWPQLDAAELRSRFPEIDAYMGPGEVADVVAVVEGALSGSVRGKPLSLPSSYLYHETGPRVRATPPWTAYVKIAEGCGHRCGFCVIPRLRGPYRSRALPSIVSEVEALAAEGVREVNLVAQDTTAYGRDTGEASISDLLSALSRIEGMHWIRLLYAYPTGVTSDLIEVMAAAESVCDYLDVPFQHADRGLLRRMCRPGDGGTYLKLIERLRAAMPDIAIRSTFLVGLPGEGEDEFRRLMDFVEAARLDRAGAFCYSQEPGTPAAEMPDQVPAEMAQERYHEFMMTQQRISLERNQRWVGEDLEVLIEGAAEPGEWIGRSFRDAPEIDGTVKIVAPGRNLAAGQFVQVRVTAAEPYDLVAEMPGPPRRDVRLSPRRSSGRGRRR